MQTIGDRIWYRIHAFVLEKIAENDAEKGFTSGMLDANHVSGPASPLMSHSATGHTAATLGNILYAAAAGVWTLLAGNTTSTRKFLRQTGTGAVSAAPAWDTLVDGDLPTTLAGKTLTAPTIADFTNANHDHGDADDGGALSAGSTVSHDHTTGDGSGVLTNDEHDGYSEMGEIAAPSTPAANKLRVYAKDSGGVSRLFYKDDGGTERGPLDTPGAAGAHDHTGGDGSGVLTNDEHDGYSEMAEIAAPSTPAASKVRLYAKDKSGVSELYYKNDAGTERDLSASGGGGGDAAGSYLQLGLNATNTADRLFTPHDGLRAQDGGANGNYYLGTGLPRKTSAADTPDDDFTAGTIDAKWAVVSGATGTVSLLEAGNVAKYDLGSMPGFLLLQTGASIDQKVELRQDYTLPDGKSIILCIYSAMAVSDGNTGQDNNEQWLGLAINDNDAGYDAGTSNILFFEVDTNSTGIAWYDFTALQGSTGTDGADPGNAFAGARMYLRIARSGLNYHGFISHTGRAWMRLGGKTLGAAATNIWIFSHSKAAGGVPVPIHTIDFFLLGDNAIIPWS